MNKGINVLSLFDGISCGYIALNRSNIKVNNYYASEIDKNAIKVAKSNHPNIIQLGDIKEIISDKLPNIDLMMGGSPCQGFSFAGKQLAFDDPRSKLFFEFIRLLNEIKPKYFLLENVKMKKQFEDIITDYMGVEPIEINSSLVSAQNRVRLYWTNIPNVIQPEDKNIKLSDIIDIDLSGTDPLFNSQLNKATIIGRRFNDKGVRKDYDKTIPITQTLEVRKTNIDKCNCLTTVDKDNVLTTLPVGRYPDVFKKKLPYRYYTLKEYCRLQTIPENYFNNIVSESMAKKMLGNGWTVDVIAHILKNMELG